VSRRARPGRPLAPMAVAVVIIGLWWLVAHNAGSGWVQLLGDLVFGVLLIGIVWPGLVVARARVVARSAPGDAAAGLAVELRVDASTRLRVRPVEPPGPEVFVGPGRRRGAVADTVTLVPLRRGVHDTVTLDIASAAPFALQWWTKRVQLPLPVALHVAPRSGPRQPPRPIPDEGVGELLNRPRSDAGLPRGARPYVPGDSRRLVHWGSTAHAGRLMVREQERPAAEPVTITVELPADAEAAERVAEGALGTLVGLLEGGSPVLLGTREPSGPVLGPVGDRRGAGRRLARAVAGPAGGGPVEGDGAAPWA
jgi:uncharacterized protein (DUF58 family)